MIGRIAASTVAMLMLLAARSMGQTLRVRVLEEGTDRIIPGALVTLTSDKGQALTRALADDRGRLSFDLSSPGQYGLIVARIGHKSLTIDRIRIEAGAVVDIDARMPEAPILLPDLVVEAESSKQCGLDGQNRAASGALWNEISKALWTFELADARPANLESSTYQKRLNRAGEVVDATATDWRPADRRPFTSPPPERLLRDGFVTSSGSGREYHGPDAALLLSEAFARRYCFSVRPSSDSALVGLAFRPAGRPEQVGVEGTLWVERRSAALRSLDFGYTNVTGLPRRDVIGGQLIFSQLGGEWIISSWRMTVPFLVSMAGRDYRTGQRISRDSLTGFVERGGEARLAGSTATRGLTIEGVVWDSIAGLPLRGATISVANGSFRTESNQDGQFQLSVSAPGTYVMTIEHPTLRTYGLGPITASARAERREATRVNAGTPTGEQLASQRCIARSADALPQLLLIDLGSRWAETVEVSWQGTAVGGMARRFAVAEDGVWIVAEVDGNGIASFCGLPATASLSLRAGPSGQTRPTSTVTPRADRVTIHSFPPAATGN